MTSIEQYIKDQGGILSGDLEKYLVQRDGIASPTARKRIERLKSPVHKISGLFSESQSFIYHSDNYRKEAFYENFKNALSVAGKRHFAILIALNFHQGLIKKEDLGNYTFSPVTKLKGHQSLSTIVGNLLKNNIISDYDQDHYQLNPYLIDGLGADIKAYKAIEFSKDLVLNQFNVWSRNIGIGSFNKGKFNSEVGGFQFAYSAPSYITGFVQYKGGNPKPGFLVADVLIGNKVDLLQVDFFVQKINAIKASNISLRLFPVLIVHGVELEALNLLKKTGIVVGTIKEIFGENYDELLRSLINTIKNAGEILRTKPEEYIQLMIGLTKLVDGQTNNLRGDLFELAVGYYHGQFCKFLEIGKKIKVESDFKEYDADVFAIYENELHIAECKGYNYPIDDRYIIKYLNEKLPTFRNWVLASSYKEKALIFEIWRTGGFTAEAQQLLEKVNTSKYRVEFYDKERILKKAKELKSPKFTTILRDYYFKKDQSTPF
ncbi:MAG: hypothetical protein JST90_06670 [Bacteroidetes bacterium]|nr:hypothetical protein [Bacteroidota bacterium]